MWKNCDADFIGQCQYRRRLEFPEKTDFNEIFENYDVITERPITISKSLEANYSSCHSTGDMALVEKIIKDKEPYFAKDYDSIVKNSTTLYYSNGFIMRKKDFRNYCEWLFSIFDEFKKLKGWLTVDIALGQIDDELMSGARRNTKGKTYQRQVFGFLSERLFSYYILSRFGKNRIKEIWYTKYEDIAT